MTTPFSSTQQLLTIRQVADALNIHHQTVRTAIKNGKLPSLRVGAQLRIRAEDLAQIVSPNTHKYTRSAVSA
jgi:excisionase family DNA binding protein